MAVNTDFKLTWLDDTDIFTFPEGWTPSNENLSPTIRSEDIDLSYNNLANKFSYGLGKNVIVLQGKQLNNNDRWKLSSAIADQKLKKLWLGEDWYFYVIGIDPRKMRDVKFPNLGMYTAAFEAVDPFYYSSNDGTAYNSSQLVWDATTQSDVPKTISLNLTAVSINTTFIEPIFWIRTENDASVSRVRITDETNRKLDVSFSQGGNEVWLIMPYLRTSYEGFLTEGPVAIKTVASPHATNDFALDLPIYLDYQGGTLHLVYSSMERAKTMQISSTAWKMNRLYPRIEPYTDTTLTITPTLGSSGAADDVFIFYQYLFRRI